MMELALQFEGGLKVLRRFDLPLQIGRSAHCGLPIRAWRVARRHACLELRDGGIWLEDYGSLGGTEVNGRRVALYGPLRCGDEIVIGPCLIQVRALPVDDVLGNVSEFDRSSQAEGAVSFELLAEVSSLHVSDIADPHEMVVRDGALLMHRQRLHERLVQALQLRRRDIGSMNDASLRAEATRVLGGLITEDEGLPLEEDREALIQALVDEAVGLGPLEPLLADPDISEIMVNRHDEIFVESRGRLHRYPLVFSSEEAVLGIIERIVAPLGRRIDDSSPMVDARLRDGSRVNAVIAPIALRGASLTIRKFPKKRLQMTDLLLVGALDSAISTFLAYCVRYRKNLIISGGTGSGKTSLLNILSNFIPAGERVVTIEDAAELRLDHAHLVSLEARPANIEGRGRVDIRDLVRNALRMRPDRIVVGECRGGEAFDMLAAMNTGHEGSLTTLHANSPRDALARLETMILMAGMDLPLSAVREHIASSIDIIVQQMRVPDGRRMITSVVEVTGIESGRIQLQELFTGQAGPPAIYCGRGIVPDCFARDADVALDMDLFNARSVCEGRAWIGDTEQA
ncbi:Flp pilus assembly complex ATPase component TadA [Alcaligenaceae bacterium CGII-47]|nr:Flp pilus assembly complex ATPase component TadA [Alcaligenaceae bacterium CGII-47]